MKQLFIELYLDEDVSYVVATILRNRGFAVTTAREEGKLGLGDSEQLAFAAMHGRAILTHNRNDFLELARTYYAAGNNHSGIIIARLRPPKELVQLLVLILDHVTAYEFQNQVRYI